MRKKLRMLACLPLLLLAGCVVGSYSRIDLNPNVSAMPPGFVKSLNKELDEKLTTLGFISVPTAKPSK